MKREPDLTALEIARRLADGSVVACAHPVPLVIALDPTESGDGHLLQGALELRLAVGDAPADRQLVAEELLRDDRDRVTAAEVADALRPQLAKPFARAVASMPAEDALSPQAAASTADILRAAADRWAFRVGLAVLPPVAVRLRSPTVEAQRAHNRRTREMERLAELLHRLSEIRRAHPDVPAAAMLQQVAPGDRGAILRAAMHAPPAGDEPRPPASGLWLVSGSTLAEVERHADPAADRMDALPPTQPRWTLRPHPEPLDALGPLRSVTRAGTARLALGAAGGVLLLDIAAPTDEARPNAPRVYATAADTAGRGFSRVVLDAGAGRLLACHGTLGVIAWDLASGRELHRWPNDQDEARDLLRLQDGQMVVGERRQARLISGHTTHELARFHADLVALLREPGTYDPADPPAGGALCHAILADGSIVTFGPTTPTRTTDRPAAGDVTAAAAWDSPIGYRILRASEGATLEAAGLDDPVVLQYTAGTHRAARLACGHGTTLSVASADRRRIILWDAWQTGMPSGEIHVAAATGHRIADLSA